MKVPGRGGLRMEGPGPLREHVPTALLNEVWKSLPSEHPCRQVLVRWTNEPEGTELEVSELESVSEQLLAFTHTYEGEEGKLGRWVGSNEGLIVDLARTGGAPLHAPVVLVLALQRLCLLQGVGTHLLVTQPSGTVQEGGT